MPDARLARTRESLPEWYRFGDAGLNVRMGCPFGLTVTKESRDQFQIWERNRRRYVGARDASGMLRPGWNVIEGDKFDTDRDHGDETL